MPRVVASTIRAYDVRKLTRSAQFNPATEYIKDGLVEDPDGLADPKARTKAKDGLSERGFTHVPASGTHGGVIAEGGVRREATLGLAALRQLHVGDDAEKTLALRRYVLGLALVALTHPADPYLRQGCLLVRDPDKADDCEFVAVLPTGTREPLSITLDDALAYARAAAEAFGVGEDRTVDFDKDRARREVAGESGSQKKKGSKKAKKKAKGSA